MGPRVKAADVLNCSPLGLVELFVMRGVRESAFQVSEERFIRQGIATQANIESTCEKKLQRDNLPPEEHRLSPSTSATTAPALRNGSITSDGWP
jgi:hypothetical protein